MAVRKILQPMKKTMFRLGLLLAPSMVFRMQHWRLHRKFGRHAYLANLSNPRTFNEKLLRSKLDGAHAEFSKLVDKADVKGWVASRLGKEIIIPTLGVYERAADVPLTSLPRPCIIKPTHASGKIIKLDGSAEPSEAELRAELNRWLDLDHYIMSGEPQYRGLQPRLICEPLLKPEKGELLDFKFWCFHGEPKFIQVDFDRQTRHTQQHFDLDWNPQAHTLRYPRPERLIEKPDCLASMVKIARELSQGFEFVRIDMYAPDGEIYFGEITFHPGSGNDPFSDYQSDLMLGNLMGPE